MLSPPAPEEEDVATHATLNDLVQHVSEAPLLSALFGFDDGLPALPVDAPVVDRNIFDPQPPTFVTTIHPNNRSIANNNNISCFLPLLNLGKETGAALKTLIADFIGLPRGVELQELRMVSMNLAMRGY